MRQQLKEVSSSCPLTWHPGCVSKMCLHESYLLFLMNNLEFNIRKVEGGWGKVGWGVVFKPVDGSLPHSPPPSVIIVH